MAKVEASPCMVLFRRMLSFQVSLEINLCIELRLDEVCFVQMHYNPNVSVESHLFFAKEQTTAFQLCHDGHDFSLNAME